MRERWGDGVSGRRGDGVRFGLCAGVPAGRTRVTGSGFNHPISPSPTLPVAKKGGAPCL